MKNMKRGESKNSHPIFYKIIKFAVGDFVGVFLKMRVVWHNFSLLKNASKCSKKATWMRQPSGFEGNRG
jgi:hypothetical protein